MIEAPARANGRRSKIRAFVEHVFAQQKSRIGLFVRAIVIGRARTIVACESL
jgi:IS5 family transposase